MTSSSIQLEVVLDLAAEFPPGFGQETISALIEFALQAEGQEGDWSFGLRFVTDPEMQALHRNFMGLDSPTDIMTFPYEDESDLQAFGESSQGGDVLISVDTARSNADQEGWPLLDELQFLVLHGVLHVLGWDDQTQEDRAAMLERQREILVAWKLSDVQIDA